MSTPIRRKRRRERKHSSTPPPKKHKRDSKEVEKRLKKITVKCVECGKNAVLVKNTGKRDGIYCDGSCDSTRIAINEFVFTCTAHVRLGPDGSMQPEPFDLCATCAEQGNNDVETENELKTRSKEVCNVFFLSGMHCVCGLP